MLLSILERLPLFPLFVACLICGFLGLALIAAGARLTMLALQIPSSRGVFDALVVTLLNLVFAMLVAFTAAGIWNDDMQARGTVQREANAIENIFALSAGFPSKLRAEIHDELIRHGRRVVEEDWPALEGNSHRDVELFDHSNGSLLALIDSISSATTNAQRLPLADTIIGQIMDVRSARLQREMIARNGVSPAQWLALLLIAIASVTALMLSNNHEFMMRLRMAGAYTVAICGAFFVIIAHNHPFVGAIRVQPTSIEQAVKRIRDAQPKQLAPGELAPGELARGGLARGGNVTSSGETTGQGRREPQNVR
jgi:hypothetical protein